MPQEQEDQGLPPGRRPRVTSLVRAGHLEYDRVLFFSDAVFAIAITLLVVSLHVGPARAGKAVESGAELRAAVPSLIGFAISFAVIGLFWLGHHTVYRYVTALDRRLILLNLVFLGTIAFLPYPTELLSLTHNQAPAVILYAACCSAAGLTEAAVWVYATHTAGLAYRVPPRFRRSFLLQILRIPAVFLLSIPVAPFSPSVAMYMWILIWFTRLGLSRFYPMGDAGISDTEAIADTEASG